MAIFKTVNSSLDKTSYKIDIKNIDLTSGHWGNEKTIYSYLDAIETFSYDRETFDKNIVLHALKLMKTNIRVKEIKFYRVPEENKLILVAITNVPRFKEFDIFSREMSISLKKEKFAFSIIEVLDEENDEIKEGKKTIPENWKLDEKLTDRLNKLKHYM